MKRTRKRGLLERLNRALTEVGIEHFDDDLEWDARVKLPDWQLAGLKRRHEARIQAKRLNTRADRPDPGEDG